jgi:hypothetical protein
MKEQVGKGRFNDARDLARHINMDSAVRQNREWVKFMFYAAGKMGAINAHTNAKDVVYTIGGHEPLLNRVVDSFQNWVSNQASMQLRDFADRQISKVQEEFNKERAVKSFQEAVFKAEKRYVREFVDFSEQGDRQLMMGSALHTSRLSTWGFVAEAEVIGLTRYRLEAQIDNRTSDFCQMIDGREFEVESARRLVNRALSVENDDELKFVHPWPDQDKDSIERYANMTEDELEAEGILIPPFHPWCRTMLVKTGEEVIMPPSMEQAEPEPEEVEDLGPVTFVTPQTFDEMEQVVSQQEVEGWNKDIGLVPAMALSKATGFDPVDIMSGKISMETLITAAGYRFAARGKVGRGRVDVDSDYDPDEGIFYQNRIEMENLTGAEAERTIRNVFRGSVALAKHVGASAVAVSVNNSNAEAMIKAGFLPGKADWDRMRRQALRDLEPGGRLDEFLDQLDEIQLSAVTDLLNSEDPRAAFGLIALTATVNGQPVGRAVLGDVDFMGALSMADREALDRFRSVFR